MELPIFASHLFCADWQHKQREQCIDRLPANHIAMVMDYAETYTCWFQNEAQSVLFDSQQIVLHPMMVYYKCPGSDREPIVTKHAIIGLTGDDKKTMLVFQPLRRKHSQHSVERSQLLSGYVDGQMVVLHSTRAKGPSHCCQNTATEYVTAMENLCDRIGTTTKPYAPGLSVLSGRMLI